MIKRLTRIWEIIRNHFANSYVAPDRDRTKPFQFSERPLPPGRIITTGYLPLVKVDKDVKYVVELNWDDRAHKWVVSSPNVKGLAGEASTIEEALVGAAKDIDWLLKANEPSTSSECEVNPKSS